MRKRLNNLFACFLLAAAVAAALAGTYCLTHSIGKAEMDQPVSAPIAAVHLEPPVPETDPLPAPQLPGTPEETPIHTYNPDIPLSAELQAVLYEVCEEHGVPVPLVLGLIEVESRFNVDAVSEKGCVGLMQINPLYAWKLEESTGCSYLTPEGNLRCGIWYLSSLMEQYGDTAVALTGYNAGYDTGDRAFAETVMAAAECWE